ncbi:hypothetical protein B0H10DRAFT_1956255 [Mycena sp. CBHHK59/15]|nr:hypothetical protein B0H10DRAFT_1956255 [Mycena sp. CBHHK59/15]
MAHYPSLAWLVKHGIEPGSRDVRVLEDFARVRRNMQAHIETSRMASGKMGRATRALPMTAEKMPACKDLHPAPQPAAIPVASTFTQPTAGPAPMQDVTITSSVQLMPSGIIIIEKPVNLAPPPPTSALRRATSTNERAISVLVRRRRKEDVPNATHTAPAKFGTWRTDTAHVP